MKRADFTTQGRPLDGWAVLQYLKSRNLETYFEEGLTSIEENHLASAGDAIICQRPPRKRSSMTLSMGRWLTSDVSYGCDTESLNNLEEIELKDPGKKKKKI